MAQWRRGPRVAALLCGAPTHARSCNALVRMASQLAAVEDLSRAAVAFGGVLSACPSRPTPLSLQRDRREVVMWSLSPDHVRHYEKHGYVSNVPVLADADVNTLLADYGKFLDEGEEVSPLWHEFHRNESGTLVGDAAPVLHHLTHNSMRTQLTHPRCSCTDLGNGESRQHSTT